MFIHTPPAAAMWTPSPVLPATLARSMNSPYRKYSIAFDALAMGEATIAWIDVDSEESPGVSGS